MDTDKIIEYLETLDPHAVYKEDSVEDELARCGLKVTRNSTGANLMVEDIELGVTAPECSSQGISPQTIISAVYQILTGASPYLATNSQDFEYENALAQLKHQAEAWENRRPSAGMVWNREACVWLDDNSTDRITLQWADWFAPLGLRFARLRAAAAQKEDSASAAAIDVDGLNQDLMQFATQLGIGFEIFGWDGELCGGTVTLGTIGVSEITRARALGLEILDDWERSLLREWSP
jgi:hypothetical protein